MKTTHRLRNQARHAVSRLRFAGIPVEQIADTCYARWLNAKSTDAELILGTMVAVAKKEE